MHPRCRLAVQPTLRTLQQTTSCALRCTISSNSSRLLSTTTTTTEDDTSFTDDHNHVGSNDDDQVFLPMFDNTNKTRVQFPKDTAMEGKVDHLVRDVPIGTMHSQDVFRLIPSLVKACCKQGTQEGLYDARRLIDRAYLEKDDHNRKVLRQKKRSEEDHDEKTTAGSVVTQQPRMVLSRRMLEYLLYGWAKLIVYKRKDRLEQEVLQNMRDVMDLMIHQGRVDSSFGIGNYQVEQRQMAITTSTPTTQQFNTYLRGLVQATKNDPTCGGAELAEGLLAEMYHLAKTEQWPTKPNTRSYTEVIMAYRHIPKRGGASGADRIFRNMWKAHEKAKQLYLEEVGEPYDPPSGDTSIENAVADNRKYAIVTPDAQTYTVLIQAHAFHGAPKTKCERVETLLLELIELGRLDAYAMTAAMQAWSNRSRHSNSPKVRAESAQKVEEMLFLYLDYVERHEKEQQQGVEAVSDTVVGDPHDETGEIEEIDNVDPESLQESLLDRVTSTEESTIDASSEVIEDDFDADNEFLAPSKPKRKSLRDGLLVIYNVALHAWARSDTQEAAPRAEALLHQMMQDPTAQPDVISFNTVIHAWSRYFKYDPASHHKAQDLLTYMQESEDTPDPDQHTYNGVMMAWAKATGERNKTRKVRDLFLELCSSVKDDTEVGVQGYSAVLTAAANAPTFLDAPSSDEELLFEANDDTFEDPYPIACTTYRDLLLHPHLQPDHLLFATMLKVIGKHTNASPTERKQQLHQVWDDACQAGQVSSFVVRSLMEYYPKDVVGQLLKYNVSKLRNVCQLPNQSWTRNVPKDQKYWEMAKRGAKAPRRREGRAKAA